MNKNIKNYFLSNLAIKAIGLLTIPITTRFLSPADYGMVSIFTVYVGFAAIILPLNSHTSIGRYFFDKDIDFSKFVSTTVIVSFSSSIILASFFFLTHNYLPTSKTFSLFFLFLIVVNAILTISSSIFMQIHEPANNSGLILKRSIYSGILSISINLIVIIFAPAPKWQYVIYGSTFSILIINIYFFNSIKEYLSFSIDVSYLKHILSYSIPLLPYALSSTILSQIDRVMIGNNSGVSESGIYSFAITISMFIFFIGDSINRSWTPTFFKHMDNKNYFDHDYDVSKNINLWCLCTIFFLFLYYEPSILLVGIKYHSALILVPIVVLGCLFEFFFTIYGRNIGYSKKTYFSSIILLLSGFLNIILNYYTLSDYGYKIAAINTVISYLFLFLIAYFVSRYILKMHVYPILKLVRPFLIILLCVTLLYFFNLLKIVAIYSFLLKLFMFIVLSLIFFKYDVLTFVNNTKKYIKIH